MRGECGRFPSGALRAPFIQRRDHHAMILNICKAISAISSIMVNRKRRRRRLSRWRSGAPLESYAWRPPIGRSDSRNSTDCVEKPQIVLWPKIGFVAAFAWPDAKSVRGEAKEPPAGNRGRGECRQPPAVSVTPFTPFAEDWPEARRADQDHARCAGGLHPSVPRRDKDY